MAKKIRFPLKLAEGAEVRTLEELREHFDLEALLGYYKNRKLLTWLEDRYLEGEAEAVRALDEAAPDFQKRLCEVFQVEYTGSDADLEEIGRRQERLKRLRMVTDEQEYIDHIDQVAFDQEDLADLLDEEQTTIYLCGEKFTVPASRKGVAYVGIHEPAVHISGTLPEDPEELGIVFRWCAVDNLPKVVIPEVPEKQEEPVNTHHVHSDVQPTNMDSSGGLIKSIMRAAERINNNQWDIIKQADMKVYGDSWSELAGRIDRFLKGIGLECYGSGFAEFLVEEFGPMSPDVQIKSLADLYKLTDDVLNAHKLDRKDIRTFRDKLIYATGKAPDYVVFGSMGWPDIGVARAKLIFKAFNSDSNLVSVNCSPWKALVAEVDDHEFINWQDGEIIYVAALDDIQSAIGEAI